MVTQAWGSGHTALPLPAFTPDENEGATLIYCGRFIRDAGVQLTHLYRLKHFPRINSLPQ